MTDTNIFSSPEKFHEHLAQVQTYEAQSPNNAISSRIQDPAGTSESNSVQHESNESVQQDLSESGEYQDADGGPENEFDGEPNESGEPLTSETEGTPQKKTHLIPQSRLKQEADRRKALEKELQTERESRIRMEAYMEALQNRTQGTERPDLLKPPSIDPIDSEAHNFYMQQINELKNQLSQVTNQTSEFQRTNHLTNVVQNQQAQFERQNPDFNQALEHVKRIERELASSYVEEDQVESYIHEKLRNVVLGAMNKGHNSAETIYNMAKKYGYNNKKEASSTPNAPNLQAINRNMAKTMSLQGVSNNSRLNSQVVDIKSTLADRKNKWSSVNPDAFHEALERARQQERAY